MKISHLTVALGLLSLVACSADTTPRKPTSTDAPGSHADATTATAAPSTTSGATTAMTDATTVPATMVPATTPAPAPVADDVCLGVLEGGASFSTNGIDRDGCSDECSQNAALNPDDTVTCTWNGAPVAITSVGTCKGVIGGGSFSTALISGDAA